MTFKFTKMHGLGNDFVVIDAVTQAVEMTPSLAKQLADRHYGIGCDQVLVVGESQQPSIDFSYRIFNADGSEVAQCGNGARCVARFIKEKGLSGQNSFRLGTLNGVLLVTVLNDQSVQVEMSAPDFDPATLPLLTAYVTVVDKLHYQLKIGEDDFQFGVVSVGNPHVVAIDAGYDSKWMSQVADFLNQGNGFPAGVNVNFMRVISPEKILLRVVERGAGFTQACGSGACAAMALGRCWGLLDEVVDVVQPGGTLQVRWGSEGDNIYLTGPAAFVFEGVWL